MGTHYIPAIFLRFPVWGPHFTSLYDKGCAPSPGGAQQATDERSLQCLRCGEGWLSGYFAEYAHNCRYSLANATTPLQLDNTYSMKTYSP